MQLFLILDTWWRFSFGFAFSMSEKTKTSVFLLVTPELGRLGEVLGDGVSQPTSSGSTTARGGTKQGQENSRKTHKKHDRELGEKRYGLGAMILKTEMSAITIA